MRPRSFCIKLLLGILPVISIGIYAVLAHKTKILESHYTLQSGTKMEVRLTLRSTWAWGNPMRIQELDVHFGAEDAPVSAKAYNGLEPIDFEKGVAVVEAGGAADVVLRGGSGSPFSEAHFKFPNHAFSERRLVHRDGHAESTFYARPFVAGKPQPIPAEVLARLSK